MLISSFARSTFFEARERFSDDTGAVAMSILAITSWQLGEGRLHGVGACYRGGVKFLDRGHDFPPMADDRDEFTPLPPTRPVADH
jgi:hypothetical protein